MEQELDNFYAELLLLYREGAGAAVYGLLQPPDDMAGFLNRLARPGERLAPLAHRLESSVEELSAAAYAFVRQNLFASGNDHYHMLGLREDARPEAIRQRYRLLIGLLHPDRVARSEGWVEQAVRSLNTAYADLKRPERRRAYDARLHKSSPEEKGQSSPGRSRRRPPLDLSPRPGEILYRIAPLQRNPRVFVWLTIVFGLLLVVLMAVNTAPSSNLMLAEPGSTGLTGELADKVPANPLMPAIVVSRDETPVVEVPATAHVSGSQPLGEAASSAAQPQPGGRVPSPAVSSTARTQPPAAGRKGAGDQPATEVSSAVQGDEAEISHAISFDGLMPLNADELPEPSAVDGADAAPGVSSAMLPEFLLMQYARAWEKGDVEAMLRLFALNGQVNGQYGRARIGSGFRRMFEATSGRVFQLKQLRIVALPGGGFEAWAQVAARAKPVNGGGEIRYGGEMILDLVPRGPRLYIVAMRHNIQALEQ